MSPLVHALGGKVCARGNGERDAFLSHTQRGGEGYRSGVGGWGVQVLGCSTGQCPDAREATLLCATLFPHTSGGTHSPSFCDYDEGTLSSSHPTHTMI